MFKIKKLKKHCIFVARISYNAYMFIKSLKVIILLLILISLIMKVKKFFYSDIENEGQNNLNSSEISIENSSETPVEGVPVDLVDIFEPVEGVVVDSDEDDR